MSEQTQEKKESEELVTKGYLKEYLDEKLENFVTKDYLDIRFDEFEEKMDEKMRDQTATLLQAVDKVITRFDNAEKDQAAHDALHHRITDDMHKHDKRIKKLEVAMG